MREKYESLSLAVLKELAKSRGLKGISTLKKAALVERMLQELKNILYVIPKYAVQENISGYTDFQWLRSKIPVDFVTFNFFTDIKKGIKKLSGYDLVVIDEAHLK